jgi:hypothetical protein
MHAAPRSCRARRATAISQPPRHHDDRLRRRRMLQAHRRLDVAAHKNGGGAPATEGLAQPPCGSVLRSSSARTAHRAKGSLPPPTHTTEHPMSQFCQMGAEVETAHHVRNICDDRQGVRIDTLMIDARVAPRARAQHSRCCCSIPVRSLYAPALDRLARCVRSAGAPLRAKQVAGRDRRPALSRNHRGLGRLDAGGQPLGGTVAAWGDTGIRREPQRDCLDRRHPDDGRAYVDDRRCVVPWHEPGRADRQARVRACRALTLPQGRVRLHRAGPASLQGFPMTVTTPRIHGPGTPGPPRPRRCCADPYQRMSQTADR